MFSPRETDLFIECWLAGGTTTVGPHGKPAARDLIARGYAVWRDGRVGDLLAWTEVGQRAFERAGWTHDRVMALALARSKAEADAILMQVGVIHAARAEMASRAHRRAA